VSEQASDLEERASHLEEQASHLEKRASRHTHLAEELYALNAQLADRVRRDLRHLLQPVLEQILRINLP